MGTLTPTFNDQPKVRITDAHEPLQDEPYPTNIGQPVIGTNSPPPVEIMNDKPTEEVPGGPLKVAIIGTAPSSRMLAPYADKTWKIWACSPGNMNILPRVDRWFEIHSTLHWPENAHYGRPYLEYLKKLDIPVYAQPIYANPHGELPKATPFPKDKVVAEFGPYFFTSSFAWMIALAIMEGAKEIALFGVDMASRDEYILQRPGGYYFLTECMRRGIKIGAPYESDILQPPPLYGFCDSTPYMRKLMAREKELKDRIGGMKQERDRLVVNITYLEGALEDLDYFKNIWGGAQEHRYA